MRAEVLKRLERRPTTLHQLMRSVGLDSTHTSFVDEMREYNDKLPEGKKPVVCCIGQLEGWRHVWFYWVEPEKVTKKWKRAFDKLWLDPERTVVV